MIAAAYRYADGEGDLPRELELLSYIDRFGLGIFGRAPGVRELRAMTYAENVVKAYRERAKAENWAAWASANPGKARLLEAGASYGE